MPRGVQRVEREGLQEGAKGQPGKHPKTLIPNGASFSPRSSVNSPDLHALWCRLMHRGCAGTVG